MSHHLYDVFEFYQDLTSDEKELLISGSIGRKLEKDRMMLGDTDRCGGIPFVQSGSIRLFRTSESGREMTVYRINTGEMCVLAAVCLFSNLPYDFTVEAAEDSILSILSAESFKNLIEVSPAFREYVFSQISTRLINTLETIELLNFSSIENRLKSYLDIVTNDNMIFKGTHENIAKDIGSSREVVSRNLKELEKAGYLSLQRGRIKINKK